MTKALDWTLRYGLPILLIITLIVIWAWPRKIGDVRGSAGAVQEVYWRGPNPLEPGKWLKLRKIDLRCSDTKGTPVLIVDDTGVHRATSIVDNVPLGHKKCLIVLSDDTAVICGD